MGLTTEYSSEALAQQTESIELNITEQYLKYMQELDEEVDDELQNVSGAIYGTVGNSLQALWDEKCGNLVNYATLFKNWTSTLSSINSTLSTAASDVSSEYAAHNETASSTGSTAGTEGTTSAVGTEGTASIASAEGTASVDSTVTTETASTDSIVTTETASTVTTDTGGSVEVAEVDAGLDKVNVVEGE